MVSVKYSPAFAKYLPALRMACALDARVLCWAYIVWSVAMNHRFSSASSKFSSALSNDSMASVKRTLVVEADPSRSCENPLYAEASIASLASIPRRYTLTEFMRNKITSPVTKIAKNPDTSL